jgi:hypothetical protein
MARGAGSPVCKLYRWGFPAYFDHRLVEPLKPRGQARLSDWRNFYYPTDPIGGPAAEDLSRADGSLVDQGLLDPAECCYVYGQPPPSSQGHSGYWADPRVWNLINQLAAGEGRDTPVAASRPFRPRAEPLQPDQQAMPRSGRSYAGSLGGRRSRGPGKGRGSPPAVTAAGSCRWRR